MSGTRKAATDILQLCFEARAWKTLNDQIVVLSKRRGQLKQVLAANDGDLFVFTWKSLLACVNRCVDVFCVNQGGLGFWFVNGNCLLFFFFVNKI